MSRENKQVELRGKVRSMVAQIYCAYDRDFNKYSSTIGTVLVANQQFCYLMVNRSMISDCGTYTIYLPDGSSMDIGPSEFVGTRGWFAGLYIYRDRLQYDITKIGAARIGEDVIDFEEVHLCDFSKGSVRGTCLNVIGGRVIDAGDSSFTHDCGTTHFIANGAPVFCENGRLVGFCNECLQGATRVVNASAIQEELNYIYNTKKIEEFYEKVSEFGMRSSAGN